MTPWYAGPMLLADSETTGTDTRTDRIVTAYAALVRLTDGKREISRECDVLINPGVPVPVEASDIHGITTAIAVEKGCDPRDGVNSFAEAISRALLAGIPVVGFNFAFDLAITHWELIRHDLPTIGERLGRSRDAGFGPIIDAHVLDKQVDPYRRGKGMRKLVPSCRAHGIELDESQAHAADFDAIAAGRLAVKIGRTYPEVGGLSLRELHTRQKGWRSMQAAGLEAHFRKTREDAYVDRCWPICFDLNHPTT